MNPLASRKQLLIAESELNRAQLVQDWQAVADGVQRGRRPGQNPRFRRFGHRIVGCRSGVLPAQKVRARCRKTFLAANPS